MREREKGEAMWRRGGIRFFDRYDRRKKEKHDDL